MPINDTLDIENDTKFEHILKINKILLILKQQSDCDESISNWQTVQYVDNSAMMNIFS